MSKNRNTAIKSMTAGAFVSVVVLAIAAFLDTLINPKMANVISLLIGLVINFVLQQMVFVTKESRNASTHLVKYIIADILILGSNQYMVSYLIDNANKYKSRLDEKLKPYYNTLSRIVVGAIIWIILSYPLRKYWVFALPPV